ncbi:MAG TPA: hypothetical protein VN901_16845 [Candidatus Acidoferrales bacterium]|nr:hypothetical protein [Candidatus Acidoferrales bacterium]
MPHDTDRTQLEFGSELSEYGEIPELASEQYENVGQLGNIMNEVFGETSGESFEGGYQEYQELPLPEVMEDELASELLEIRSDQELDHFLGDLFKKVASGIGAAIQSPVGQALGGVLKQVAKKALPLAGGALGTFVGGPLGGMVGSKLASMAGDAFGLEHEGLSAEDRDFETARRYVRFAGEAAKRAAYARPDLDPRAVAKAALIEAAKLHAPGLLATRRFDAGVAAGARAQARRDAALFGDRPGFGAANYPSAQSIPGTFWPPAPGVYSAAPTCPSCGTASGRHRRTGKWIRRGRHIVLLGV